MFINTYQRIKRKLVIKEFYAENQEKDIIGSWQMNDHEGKEST